MSSLMQYAKVLTFDNEGNSNPRSKYYSRKASWPGKASGVTIGRGYDMRERSKAGIRKDLMAAGLSDAQAKLLSEGAGLTAKDASAFVNRDDVKQMELTAEQEEALFEITYAPIEATFRRICRKQSVEKRYGHCDLAHIDPAIQAWAVDLTYTGNYTPATRRKIQKAIVSNDFDTLIQAAKDRTLWGHIDGNRYKQRVNFLIQAKQNFLMRTGNPFVGKPLK